MSFWRTRSAVVTLCILERVKLIGFTRLCTTWNVDAGDLVEQVHRLERYGLAGVPRRWWVRFVDLLLSDAIVYIDPLWHLNEALWNS